jgi:hypothetical protein
MTRRTALTAALLAGLLLAGMAVPANAEQSPRASCVMGPHKVEAEGIYTNLSNPRASACGSSTGTGSPAVATRAT